MEKSLDIPSRPKGVVIHREPENELKLDTYELGELKKDEIIIKIHSGVVNPSDVLFVQGLYPVNKQFPIPGGFEGSGLVVKAGSDAHPQALLGQRVCFLASAFDSPGSWSQFTRIQASTATIIPDNLSYEEGACCLVNPLTVQCFLDICKKNGFTSIVHSAAASQVGRMLLNGCQRAGITLINVVRRQDQVDILNTLGAKYIVNTDSDNWKKEARKIFSETKPLCFFDALGDEVASEVIELLPRRAITYVYGALGFSAIKITPMSLIFAKKRLDGFWLNHYLKDNDNQVEIFQGALENLSSGNFKTIIAEKYGFEQFEQAMESATINTSKGKVLICNPYF